MGWEDQERDEAGRFGSGGGSATSVDSAFSGSTVDEAQNFWRGSLQTQWSSDEGLVLQHEAPGHIADDFARQGIKGEAVYAAVGAPSNFVIASESTRVHFKPAYAQLDDIVPDDKYGSEDEGYLRALKDNGSMRGMFVAMRGSVTTRQISKIEELRNGRVVRTVVLKGGRSGGGATRPRDVISGVASGVSLFSKR
jgi:hypothetical protein